MKKTILVLFVLFASLSPVLAIETTFSPRVRVTEEYTDNLHLTPDNEVDDFITTTGVGASLGFRGATAALTLAYDPEYASYQDNSYLNAWRHFASLDGNWQMTRFTRLGVTDTFTISDDPADDIETDIQSRGRNRYTRNTAHAEIAHQFGREDSVEMGYEHMVLKNELPTEEDSQSHNPYMDFLWWFVENEYGFQAHADYRRGLFEYSDDFDSWFGDFRLRKRFTRNFDMFLQYAHMITQYDHNPDAADAATVEDYVVYNPGVGLNYIAGENTNISVAAGYAFRDREFGEDDEGPVVTSDLRTAWIYPRSLIELTASSGYTQDTFSTDNRGFNVFGAAGCRAEYGFTSRLRGDVAARYRYVRYLDEDPVGEDQFVDAGPGIAYQALSWMRFRLEYTYRTVFSNTPEDEYAENRAMLSLILEPATPYRWN
ncbi:MAG: outer membrane beta-barrel protein [Desulfatitalea sp.]|nr:outer membrane beta-barrel protein [Desulfatitalea sp.]MBI5897233.1 outer membrane beta-barrel protein [Desulfobacterales bacterium]